MSSILFRDKNCLSFSKITEKREDCGIINGLKMIGRNKTGFTNDYLSLVLNNLLLK